MKNSNECKKEDHFILKLIDCYETETSWRKASPRFIYLILNYFLARDEIEYADTREFLITENILIRLHKITGYTINYILDSLEYIPHKKVNL